MLSLGLALKDPKVQFETVGFVKVSSSTIHSPVVKRLCVMNKPLHCL